MLFREKRSLIKHTGVTGTQIQDHETIRCGDLRRLKLKRKRYCIGRDRLAKSLMGIPLVTGFLISKSLSKWAIGNAKRSLARIIRTILNMDKRKCCFGVIAKAAKPTWSAGPL
jgi:hypothetical protein